MKLQQIIWKSGEIMKTENIKKMLKFKYTEVQPAGIKATRRIYEDDNARTNIKTHGT